MRKRTPSERRPRGNPGPKLERPSSWSLSSPRTSTSPSTREPCGTSRMPLSPFSLQLLRINLSLTARLLFKLYVARDPQLDPQLDIKKRDEVPWLPTEGHQSRREMSARAPRRNGNAGKALGAFLCLYTKLRSKQASKQATPERQANMKKMGKSRQGRCSPPRQLDEEPECKRYAPILRYGVVASTSTPPLSSTQRRQRQNELRYDDPPNTPGVRYEELHPRGKKVQTPTLPFLSYRS